MQTEINYKQLGKRIQEKRKDMGIMQKDMAVAIGTAFNHLSDVERGAKKPSLELLMRISDYLDTPVDYFLMGNPPSCKSYAIDEDLSSLLVQCTPQSLAVVRELAQSLLTYQDAISENTSQYSNAKEKCCP